MRSYPRCANTSKHGNSKRAIPHLDLAEAFVQFLRTLKPATHLYRCELPAPAIGEHYHISTRKKRASRA